MKHKRIAGDITPEHLHALNECSGKIKKDDY
jgi:hypothetical protein